MNDILKPLDLSPQEVARRYAALDQQGRDAVQAVLRAEIERCGVVFERTLFDRWLDGVGDELLPLPLPTRGK